ncbi:hypothetical protein TRVL_07987 [Trypanosoma vivax]|nr:hypothetical protein TRVL_07987 [Trypanosoma vivax]
MQLMDGARCPRIGRVRFLGGDSCKRRKLPHWIRCSFCWSLPSHQRRPNVLRDACGKIRVRSLWFRDVALEPEAREQEEPERIHRGARNRMKAKSPQPFRLLGRRVEHCVCEVSPGRI